MSSTVWELPMEALTSGSGSSILVGRVAVCCGGGGGMKQGLVVSRFECMAHMFEVPHALSTPVACPFCTDEDRLGHSCCCANNFHILEGGKSKRENFQHEVEQLDHN